MASVSTKIAVEGAAKFKDDFKSAGQAVKSASAELKYFSNELTRTGASEDALNNKAKALEQAFRAEQEAIDLLQNRIDQLNQTTGGEAVDEINKWTTELYKHKDAQAQLQNELTATQNELQGFSEGADKSSTEVRELGDDSESAGQKISNAFAQEVARATVGLEVMWDLGKKAAKVLWDIGKDAVMYNAEMESYSKTIEAFFRTSGQSAEEASANTAQLIQNQKELSVQVGIGTDKLIDANKMLIASGASGESSQRAISALAKAVVATGGGNEELSRMAQNLQQISNTGKASTQDMKQFAMAGIDMYGLLADSMGLTVDQLKEMDITYDMIVEAMDLATAEGGKFYEASQVGATTLNGQMNLLQSTIKDKLGTAFQPFNDALANKIIPKALELAEGIDWDALGEMMADAAQLAATTFGVLADTIGTVAEAYVTVKAAIDDWGNVSERVNRDVSQGYIGMSGAFKRAYDEEVRFASGSSQISHSVKLAQSDVDKAVAGIPPAFTNRVPAVQSASAALGNAGKSGVAGMYGTMSAYGADAGNGFAAGLSGSATIVGKAAAAVANAAKKYLHFSRPDVGPLRDYETWMPDFVQGLADTMRASEWKLAEASEHLAGVVTNNATTNNISMNVYGSAGQSPNEIADVVMLKIQQATSRRQQVWA